MYAKLCSAAGQQGQFWQIDHLSAVPKPSPCTVRTQGAHGEGDHGGQRLVRHEEAGQVQHRTVAAERDAEVRVCTQGVEE
jgi:hypothetical protein